MTDAETTFEWNLQIVLIRKRFEAALRAGETIDSLDLWVQQVPEPYREELRNELEACRFSLAPESVQTRVLTSDAAIGSHVSPEEFFSFDNLNGENAVNDGPTFRGMSKEARISLQENFQPRAFPLGTQLMAQGEPTRGLHLILKGSVDIVDTQTGERIDCDGAGSVLGEMSLLTGEPCSAEVVATSDVDALVLSSASYELLKEKHPELEIALSQLVSDRLGGRRHDALCGKTIGAYRLKRCINRGGMGVVYEANKVGADGSIGEAVALKMLRHRFIYDDQMQSRFDQEARLLGDLLHPNIVSFREHFLAYRTRFLVLDLCDGADLYQILRVHGAMTEERVRAILGQIAEGLMYAQDAGIIHRDLKPGNVLIDRRGQVKLTDFGLSKLLKEEVLEGKAVGTPSYMPPEQFRSEDIGPEADWYALGCLASELLTGQILFNGENWMDLFRMKCDREPTHDWPSVNVSDELRAVLHGALQPVARKRSLDLEMISRWSEPVEGLF
jgi:tRNA A-37 threonylcarbamoyl transferase component Bud32